jgi:hypothetical protein
MAGRTTRRGYGWDHQRLRAAWQRLVEVGAVTCSHCGERIRPGQRWHLAHAEIAGAHRAGLYAGPQHERCNVAAAQGKRYRPRPRPPALAIFDGPPKRNGSLDRLDRLTGPFAELGL